MPKLPPTGPEALARYERVIEPFEAMAGRAMKGWVLVPLEHAKRWNALAEQAWTFMTS